jgi:hypothetical protein
MEAPQSNSQLRKRYSLFRLEFYLNWLLEILGLMVAVSSALESGKLPQWQRVMAMHSKQTFFDVMMVYVFRDRKSAKIVRKGAPKGMRNLRIQSR